MLVSQSVSLGSWLLRWVNIYIRPARKPKTVENYTFVIDVLRRNIPSLFDSDINSLVELNFQDGINSLSNRYSKSVCKTLRSVLKRAYASAIRNKICSYTQNPAANLVIPATAHEEQIYAFSSHEQDAIRQAAEIVFQGHLAIFLLDTGLRCCELYALRWNDYNPEKHTINIRESKTKAGCRIIPLIPEAEQIILNQPHCNEFIFTSRIGTPISKTVMRKLCTRLEAASGVKQIRPHRFRHTFATRLVELGVDYKALSTLMGHTSVAFTMARYVNVEVDFLRDQINLLTPLSGKAEDVSSSIHTESQIEKADCLCLYAEQGEPVPPAPRAEATPKGNQFPCSTGKINRQRGTSSPCPRARATPKGNQFPLPHGRKQSKGEPVPPANRGQHPKRGTSSPCSTGESNPKGNQFPCQPGAAAIQKGNQFPLLHGQQSKRGTSSPCSTGSSPKGEPVPLLHGRTHPKRGTSSPCFTGGSSPKGEPVPLFHGQQQSKKGTSSPCFTGSSNPTGEPVPLFHGQQQSKKGTSSSCSTGEHTQKGEPVPPAPRAAAIQKGNQFPLLHGRQQLQKGNQFPLVHMALDSKRLVALVPF